MNNGGGGVAELTEALGTLATAEQAKADFLEGLDDLDVNADGEIDLDGGVDVEAGEAGEGDVETFYANASAAMGGANNVDISNFADRSASIQDAAIADRQEELEKAVQDETDDAADGMTSLLETLEARQKSYAAQAKNQAEAEEAHDDEVTAFEAVNETALNADYAGKSVAEADGSLYFDGETFGTLSSDGDGGLEIKDADQVASLVDGEWVFEDGETELKGLADLYAEVQALAAADQALASAKAAVNEAVEDIIILENDVHSVAALNSATSFSTGEDGKATVNLDATNVEVYETEADSEETETTETVDAVAEEFTVTFSGSTSSDGSATVTFDDVEVSLAQGADAATIGAAVAAETYTNWTAVDNEDGTVTFTAAEAGAQENVAAEDFVFADDGTDGSADADSVTIDQEGSDETTTTTSSTNPTPLDAAAPDAADLAEAIQALADFEELTAIFEQARDLNNELESLNDDIEDATAAIENDPEDEDAPGLGVELATFEDGAQGTSDNEVFLFEDSTDADITIGDFGTGGEDKIYFGEGFSLVEITGDKGIQGNLGDASAMEIFWEEEGSNLNLYVEAEAFGGNSAGTADLTKIVLTGVSAEDITDDLGNGFLVAGEIA